MPTIDEFARITRNVIARDGFDDYLPTALYPARTQVVVLEGVPEGVDVERIALDWAAEGAIDDEEFLVAFKVDPTRFKVIRRHSGRQEQGVFATTVDDV
jgi:hypothetical protein